MKPLLNKSIFILALLAMPLAVQAQVSMIKVSGVFDSTQSRNDDNLNSFASLLNKPFSFYYSYDPSVADTSDMSDNFGTYPHTAPPNAFFLVTEDLLFDSSDYSIRVIGPPSASSYFSFSSGITNFTGLKLPNGASELGFGLFHAVSDSAVSFLDNGGAGIDPLPVTPFFLGEPLDSAEVRVSFTIPGLPPTMTMPSTEINQETTGRAMSITQILPPADGLLIEIEEDASGVFITATGSLAFGQRPAGISPRGVNPNITPNTGDIAIGTGLADTYGVSYTGNRLLPDGFGPGTRTAATTSYGDALTISDNDGSFFIRVPAGYSNGSDLFGFSRFDGETLQSLGLIEGTYEYGYSSTEVTDTITVNISNNSPIPEPTSLALLGLSGLMLCRRRR